jgi:hypothetical protein
LSFSKKLNNHVGAIWYFIHDYNLQIAMRWTESLLPNHYPAIQLTQPNPPCPQLQVSTAMTKVTIHPMVPCFGWTWCDRKGVHRQVYRLM